MSDPSGIQVPVTTSLTSDMALGLKPSAPRSRTQRISHPPINKNIFVGGDQLVFEIGQNRKNTWLDTSSTYLKFSVQCTSTAAATQGGSGIYVDNSAYSFLQRLDVYNGSNLLEQYNEYGQLCNFLIDTSLTQSDKAGISTLIGTNYTTTVQSSQAAYAQYQANAAIQAPGDRSGMSLASVTPATGINNAIPYNFCLPLLSGVCGINCSKMLPTGILNAPIRLEFYLSANDDAIYYGTAGAGCVWQIVNVELVCTYVELYDDVMSEMFHQGVPQYISTKTYRAASTFLPSATAGEWTTLVPFRCASLCSIYTRFRNQATSVQGANATAAYRKGSSINPNIASFYYRVGSTVMPNKPVYLINGTLVGQGSEAYAELLKSFHALSSSIGNSALVSNQYNVNATATQGWSGPYLPGSKANAVQDTCNNAFAIGLELESFSNRSDTILSGVNTLNTQVYFTANLNSGVTAGGTNAYNYTVDFFGQMDMILVIQDGIMSAKF